MCAFYKNWKRLFNENKKKIMLNMHRQRILKISLKTFYVFNVPVAIRSLLYLTPYQAKDKFLYPLKPPLAEKVNVQLYFSFLFSLIISNLSPVIESHKNSCFAFIYDPVTSRKFFAQTRKWSTSSKISDFQNGGKSPWHPFSYIGSKFKCLQLIYRWKGNFIRINIVLRTRVQKCTYFELLIEN